MGCVLVSGGGGGGGGGGLRLCLRGEGGLRLCLRGEGSRCFRWEGGLCLCSRGQHIRKRRGEQALYELLFQLEHVVLGACMYIGRIKIQAYDKAVQLTCKVRWGYSDGGVIPIVGCLCYQTKFGNSSVVPQGRLSASLPCGTTEELTSPRPYKMYLTFVCNSKLILYYYWLTSSSYPARIGFSLYEDISHFPDIDLSSDTRSWHDRH